MHRHNRTVANGRIMSMGRSHLAIRNLVFVAVLSLFSQLCLALDAVGNVLLSAGEAFSTRASGEQGALKQGDALYEGDRITTGKASMVQIKMIDDALLILQADSELVIEAYKYNPASPADQAAKLTLNKGRLRSITGKLGESNHDAFRLNTPIAAIGIRGTDFEISTDAEVTRVRLNSGAVVFSAFNEQCLPEALGPCQSESSLLLTENLETPAAELRATDSAPRLIQLRDFNHQSRAGESATEDNLLAQQQAQNIAKAVEAGKGDSGQPTDPGIELPNDWVDKIHWGRWANVNIADTPTSIELQDAGKEILFTNDVFVLFRDQGFAQLGQDKASFRLQNAQAVIVGNATYDPVNVTSGVLTLDFLNRLFTTELSLSSSYTGNLSLAAGGTVDNRGLLRSDEGNMSVLGALSGGGDQAGYLFQHSLNSDLSVQGATQWITP